MTTSKRKKQIDLTFGKRNALILAAGLGFFGSGFFFPIAPIVMGYMDKNKEWSSSPNSLKWKVWTAFGVLLILPLLGMTGFMIPGKDPVQVATEEVVESVQEVVEPGSSEEVVEPEWVRPTSGNDPKWVTADCKNVPDGGTYYAFDPDKDQVAFLNRQKECYPPKEETAPKPQTQTSSPETKPVFSDTDTRNQYATTYGQFRSRGYGHGEAADKTRGFLTSNGFNYDALGNVNRNFRLGVRECYEEMNDPFCGQDSY